MKRIIETRKSTLIGLLGGVFVLAVTAIISHQDIAALINLPGLIIVLGGTLAATLVSRPVHDVMGVFKSLRRLMHDENKGGVDDDIPHLLNIAYWYRAGNIKEAEQAITQISDPLLRAGAQLVIDQEPIHDIVRFLQWRIASVRTKEQGDANILRAMATFAPAFGMLGTLFGLMQMLSSLGHGGLPEMGATMSFTLTTTLYGLVLANMIFRPLAMKMDRRVQHQIMGMNFILEGIMLLHQRRHPMIIKEALTMYMSQLQSTQHAPIVLAKTA